MIVKKYKIKFIGKIEGGGLGVSNIFKDVDVIPLEGGIVDHREDLKKIIPWFDYVNPKVHRAKVDGKVLIYGHLFRTYRYNRLYSATVTVAYSKSARPLTDIENWAWITVFGASTANLYGTRLVLLSVGIKKGYYYYIAIREYDTATGFRCVFLPDRYRFPQIGTEYLKGRINENQFNNYYNGYLNLDFNTQSIFYNNTYLNKSDIKGSKTFYNPSDNDGPANNINPSQASINHVIDKVRTETNDTVISHMNTEILKVIDKK